LKSEGVAACERNYCLPSECFKMLKCKVLSLTEEF